MLAPDKTQRYVAGLDLGKKQDYTVLVIKTLNYANPYMHSKCQETIGLAR